MSSLVSYKTVQIVQPDPTGAGGLALNTNFIALADADDTKLDIDDNLSDLNNVTTAVTNLGLANAALTDQGNTFTVAQTIGATANEGSTMLTLFGSLHQAISTNDAIRISQKTASTAAFISFWDSGNTDRWLIGMNTNNTLQIFDLTHSLNTIITDTSGNLSFGTNTTVNGKFATSAASVAATQAVSFICTDASGTGQIGQPVRILPTYNQASTAGGTDLTIKRTETAVGTGNQRLIDMIVGSTSQAYLTNKAVLYIANSSSVPSSNPSGGGFLYVDSGALKYRGSSGTVTVIAPA